MASIGQEVIQMSLKSLAPPLSYELHKGQSGRIGIIGGSKEYTGAPYFAAITALRVGADLSHVFCPNEAAPVIKSYSPELIVHPLLSRNVSFSIHEITPWLPRLHSLVIGPGLGRDQDIMTTVQELLKVAKEQEKNIVIDADGLHLITEFPELVKHYTKCILTPNAIEFQRLYQKMLGEATGTHEEQTVRLAQCLGGVTVVRKGFHDIISNGEKIVICEEKGSPCRRGGQGDLLSGCLGVMTFWSELSKSRSVVNNIPGTLLASYTSCLLVKKCASFTYKRLGRSMLAGDMVTDIGRVSCELFDQ